MVAPAQTSSTPTNSGFQIPNGVVHVAARATQVFCATGVVFSTLAIPMQLSALASGGSFLYYGSIMIIRSMEALIAYDLAKIASNVASVFSSRALITFANTYLGENVANVVEKAENYFTLPQDVLKKAKDDKSNIDFYTHDTLLAHQMNPYIKNWFSPK